MKLFLILIFLSINVFSAQPQIQESSRSEKETGINIYDQDSISKETDSKYKEDTLIYYRSGVTVGRFPDPDSSKLMSFGFRRLPSHFFYGLEYSTYTSADKNKTISTTQAHVGYRVIWDNRFLPYAVFNAGHANFNDSSGLIENASGVSTGLDLGLDLMKFYKIKLSTGIRFNQILLNSKIMPQASFTDLYTIIGFEF